MALPATIRVKLSSEAAGSISLTPVVAQEMALRDLVEHMLGITGKNEARIRELLLRGSVVSGASRFRWAGWDADAADLRELLATFPDPNPTLAFRSAECTRVILRGGRQTIEFTREAGSRKGLFQRKTYWDLLMEVLGAPAPEYSGYSYRDRSDRFVRELSVVEVAKLRGACDLVRYSTLRDLLRTIGFTQAEIYTTRSG
ncbi:MAG: hypothetical protein JWP63_4040 [Candidatus Solibacter sp.]|nr:hypothetical protein [Candidatus Solibacter sp.]